MKVNLTNFGTKNTVIQGSKMSETEEVKPKSLDEDDRFADDPEAKYRLYSVISYFVILIAVGLPVWWITTRVYRASLPLSEMANYDVPDKTIRENSVPLSLEYDVLITILNPDPQNLKVDLDGRIFKLNLDPFLKTVEPLANFTVKSQWLYLTDLGVKPKKMNDYFVILEEKLPLVITPLEKKIWSHMSTRPTLNLIIYISKCDTPIFIYTKQNKILESNAFLSPRWGGITIVNADKESCDKGLYEPNIEYILSMFITQLKQLIGLKGNTEKDLINLKITKTVEMINSTRRTLKSLAQLLSEINSIVISDEVALKVNLALENADKADLYLRHNDVDNALKAAKLAYSNSESAFSDPSLLALLYFPDDQKYAVYIPLYLPMMIPVFMSLTTIRKWYLKGKVKEKTE